MLPPQFNLLKQPLGLVSGRWLIGQHQARQCFRVALDLSLRFGWAVSHQCTNSLPVIFRHAEYMENSFSSFATSSSGIAMNDRSGTGPNLKSANR